MSSLADLEELDIGMTAITTLDALRPLSKLRVLGLFGAPIRSWPPLRDLPRLEELTVMHTSLSSFAGVEDGLALRKLDAGPSHASSFSDLTPLARLTELEDLNIDGLEHLADLSPLRGLTKLRFLQAGESAVTDLTPLASLTQLENVMMTDTAIESVAPLGGLPNLLYVTLSRSEKLRSILPLAACPRLEKVECDDCDALQGPATVEQLRAPPPEKAKRYPSAGLPANRPGSVPAFDCRGHLPKRPPEGWSLPERGPDDDQAFWIEAESEVGIVMVLLGQDDDRLVAVHMWKRDRTTVNDKTAARILRRFRSSDSFVESEEMLAGDVPGVRCFLARAYASTPDAWGACRDRGPLLRVEESASPVERTPEPDVRHHLPHPLPGRWSMRPTPKEPIEVACLLYAPEAEMTVLLKPVGSGDGHELVVSSMMPRKSPTRFVSDVVARALLEPFRGRGAFEESSFGPSALMQGMRLFVAPAKGGPPAKGGGSSNDG